MKRIFKIVAITIGILLLLLLSLPLLFEGKIIDLVKKTANNNINATLDFEKADVSLLSSFPNVSLHVQDLHILNQGFFQGDTLVAIKDVSVTLPFKSLFNDASEAIAVKSFSIDRAQLSIKVDSLGKVNYDILKKDTNSKNLDSTASEPFTFNLQDYSITNSSITYTDQKSELDFSFSNLNHTGRGNLSADKSILKTTSEALVSLGIDGIEYLKNNALNLTADFDLNFKENTYSFLENKAKINELDLVFDGFVKVNEENQEVSLSFETPSSDFKNFLALIPKVYSKNIEGVTTTGNFDVKGVVTGIVDETHIPTFDITITSDNASFKYPELPKSLKNIQIDTKIANTTGLTKDTYVAIDKFNFQIDDETFTANALLKDLTDNMKVTAGLKGMLDLSKLEQIYPAEQVKDLQGLLNANLNMAFDMYSIEKKKYENTKVSGTASIADFKYASNELKNPLTIKNTALSFNPKTVKVNKFDATIGETDMNISGSLNNFLGFLFNNENIEGDFIMQSDKFVVNDFMTSNEGAEENTDNTATNYKEQLSIPSFLDANLKATAKTVVYDNITLSNVSGDLRVKDQTASLKNMRSDVFGGKLGFDGLVSTQTETPTFTMKLDVANFDIGQSFTSLELFKALAPIANTIKGKLNTTISLSGDLNTDFTPNLATLSGDVLGQLTSSVLNTEASPLLQKLTSKLNFFDAKKLNLDDLKASLRFKDGKVTVKPFSVNYDDIEIAVGGGHGFDRTMDYDAVFNIPAKYLGKEAEKLLAQLTEEEQATIRVPVTAFIDGSFTDPAISTDLKGAITSLTKQVASNQKDKLVNKGKEQLNSALDKLLNKNKDTTKADSTSVKKPDVVKETAKDLLKGIFGSKKKKRDSTTVKKDTVN